jgi:hypothetical protein
VCRDCVLKYGGHEVIPTPEMLSWAEEITEEVTLVEKTVTDDEFGTRTFYGIRVFLASPDVLHHSEADDDRSAITFWVPEGHSGRAIVGQMLSNMQRELSKVVLVGRA